MKNKNERIFYSASLLGHREEKWENFHIFFSEIVMTVLRFDTHIWKMDEFHAEKARDEDEFIDTIPGTEDRPSTLDGMVSLVNTKII